MLTNRIEAEAVAAAPDFSGPNQATEARGHSTIAESHSIVLTEPDRAEAERFMEDIGIPVGESVTFQTFSEKSPGARDPLARVLHGTLAKCWPSLRKLHADGAAIFLMVNKGDGKGRTADNVIGVRCLFVDLDGAPLEPAVAALPPHAVVQTSPGRWHVYWRIEGCTLDQFEPMQRALAARFRGDPVVRDLPRVMRLPGFPHRKGEPFPVRLVSDSPDLPPYPLEDLERLAQIEAAPATTERKALDHDAVVAAIERGENLHDNLGRLLASLAARGASRAILTAIARGLLELSRPVRGARVDEMWRSGEVARLIEGAIAKYAFGEPDTRPVNIFATVVAPVLAPDDFPPVLRDYFVPLARAAGHDPAAYLLAALCATAAAISDGVRIELDRDTQWHESPRLWVLLLGSPGSAKTPAIRAATEPLRDLHRELRDEHERKLASLPEDAPRPKAPAIYTNDPTIEALSDVLAANPAGVVAIFEELDSFIGGLDAYRGGQGSKDRGEWLRLFDGGPHQVDRVKRGSLYVPNWGVSILGATTPAGLRRHAKNLPADGLIQRFMPVMVCPAGPPCATSVDRAGIAFARARFDTAIREAYALLPDVVAMSPEAQTLFSTRREALRGEIDAAASISEPMAGHIAKHAAMLGRVALVLHVLDNGLDSAEVLVSGDTMQRATNILRTVARHALAMFDVLGNDDASPMLLARAVGRSLVASGAEDVTRRDLIHGCRAFRDAGEPAREACLRFLIDAAWLSPREGARHYSGRPATFTVNPQASALFAAEGDALKARRAAVRGMLGG